MGHSNCLAYDELDLLSPLHFSCSLLKNVCTNVVATNVVAKIAPLTCCEPSSLLSMYVNIATHMCI